MKPYFHARILIWTPSYPILRKSLIKEFRTAIDKAINIKVILWYYNKFFVVIVKTKVNITMNCHYIVKVLLKIIRILMQKPVIEYSNYENTYNLHWNFSFLHVQIYIYHMPLICFIFYSHSAFFTYCFQGNNQLYAWNSMSQNFVGWNYLTYLYWI